MTISSATEGNNGDAITLRLTHKAAIDLKKYLNGSLMLDLETGNKPIKKGD